MPVYVGCLINFTTNNAANHFLDLVTNKVGGDANNAVATHGENR